MGDENTFVLNTDKVDALVNTERVLRTLKLMATILTGISKVTVGFELDNQIAAKLNWLLDQSWFVEVLDMLMKYFEDKEPSKENVMAFLENVKGLK